MDSRIPGVVKESKQHVLQTIPRAHLRGGVEENRGRYMTASAASLDHGDSRERVKHVRGRLAHCDGYPEEEHGLEMNIGGRSPVTAVLFS
jgi:hypothetical protein